MAAEGGTGFGHGVTLARSRDIAGPYQPGPVNPFLTSNPAPYFGRNDHDYLRPHLYNPHARSAEGRTRLAGRDTRRGVVRRPPLCATDGPGPARRCWAARRRCSRSSGPTTAGSRLTAGGTVAQLRTPAPGDSGDALPSEHVSYESFRDDFDGRRYRPAVLDPAPAVLRRTGRRCGAGLAR